MKLAKTVEKSFIYVIHGNFLFNERKTDLN